MPEEWPRNDNARKDGFVKRKIEVGPVRCVNDDE